MILRFPLVCCLLAPGLPRCLPAARWVLRGARPQGPRVVTGPQLGEQWASLGVAGGLCREQGLGRKGLPQAERAAWAAAHG